MSIGENIKSKRERSQTSQKVLADILGVAENTVASWEKGKNVPPSDKVIFMARYFHCSTDEILLEQHERDSETEMKAVLRKFTDLPDQMKPLARSVMISLLTTFESESGRETLSK